MDTQELEILKEALIELSDQAIPGAGTEAALSFEDHEGHGDDCTFNVAVSVWSVLKRAYITFKSTDAPLLPEMEKLVEVVGEAVEAGTFEGFEPESPLSDDELASLATELKKLSEKIVPGTYAGIHRKFIKAMADGGTYGMHISMLNVWDAAKKLRAELEFELTIRDHTKSPLLRMSKNAIEAIREAEESGKFDKLEEL